MYVLDLSTLSGQKVVHNNFDGIQRRLQIAYGKYSGHHRIAAAIVCIWEEIYNAALLRSKKDQWAGRVSTRKLTSVLGLLPKIPALPDDLQKRIVGPQGSVTCARRDDSGTSWLIECPFCYAF